MVPDKLAITAQTEINEKLLGFVKIFLRRVRYSSLFNNK